MLIKSFSTILFITVSVVAVFSQPKELQDSGKDTLQAYSFYQEAGRLAKIRQLDSSRYYMNMAANEYEAAGEWDRYFDVVYQVSYLYSQEYNYEVSLSYLDSIWNKFSTYFNPEYKSAIDYYGSYALVNMNLFNYIESLNYFKKLEDILVQNLHATPENHLFTYYYHGVIYYRLGQYDEALKLMLRCLDFGVKNKNTSYEGSVYNLLGIIYRRLGEYDRALNFYEKTLALDSPHKTEVQLTPVYNNLGRVHNYLGNYQTALNYFNLGLSALEDYSTDYYTVESRLVNNKAILLIEQGSYTEATIILTHVLEREKSKFGGLGKNSVETLQQLGTLKFKSKNYSDAEHYYHLTLSMMEESLGANNSLLSDIYVRLGQNYLALKQFNDALDAFQYAIAVLVVGFDHTDYLDNPEEGQLVLDKLELIKSLQAKAGGLMDYYHETGEEKLLIAAFESNTLALDYFDLVRQNLYYGKSKQALSGLMKSLFEQSIVISMDANEKMGESDPVYLQSIFRAMEGSKSYLLSFALQESEFEGYSRIPDTLKSEEKMLFMKISFYEKKLNQLEVKADADSTEIIGLRDNLFTSRSEYEDFMRYIKSVFPDYLYMKSGEGATDVASVQQMLKNDELLIEYFAGEEQLYAIAISQGSIEIYELGNYKEIKSQIQKFINISPDEKAYQYQESAFNMYREILYPIVENFPDKGSLIIIPDGMLGYLPYDALVTIKTKNPAFSNLHYEIFDHSITQHYLASLYFRDNTTSDTSVSGTLIGYAPDFEGKKTVLLATRNASDSTLTGNLLELPFARMEVEAVSAILMGEAIIGSQASESHFKRYSGNFQIIHVASHSIIDDSNPLFSKLIFAPEKPGNGSEDGLLHAFELYDMHFNCDLVTLSACNTGVGKFYNGEGIISLARGFIYAGASSVLMSLWEVGDESTSQIMGAFYSELEKGVSKNKAIRNAKLAYLENADGITSNPYYWAGFTYLGNREKEPANEWIYFLPLLLIGLVIALRKKKRR